MADPACAELELDAPAKVNLGLRIAGRRPDGYHELASLFVPLDLADGIALRVEPADAISVSLDLAGDGLGAPGSDDNLASRAARAFLERSGVVARVRISLRKRTPVAAGLGGGSSDAAAVLRGLARAFPRALPGAALEEVALSLGADVPYFLDPQPAWVTGIGERRQPVAGVPRLVLLLVNPGEALPTAEVFRAFDAIAAGRPRGESPPRDPPCDDLARRFADDRALAALLHNDLEEVAVRLCPAIGRLRHDLAAAGARAIGMSGSGATMFGVFADRAAAERTASQWTRPGWTRVAVTGESR